MSLLSLSQRDPRWSKIPLGTSKTTTIGSHGCTISSLAMLLGTTPEVVNKRLLSVNGYANTNLIIWSKIPEAFPGSSFKVRGYAYHNEIVKAAIAEHGGCLVEVDGARIGAPTHWVLYIGNGRMIDPWTGVEKATNYYPAKGYAVVVPPKNMPENPLETCLQDREKFWKERDEERAKNESLILQLKEKEEEVNRLKGEVAEKASALKTVRDELSGFTETLASKLTTIVDKSEIIGAVDRLLSGESEYIKKVNKLEKAYALLEDEKKLEIEALKRSIEELKEVNEKQATHISKLEERLENLEAGEVRQRSLFEVIKELIERIKKWN